MNKYRILAAIAFALIATAFLLRTPDTDFETMRVKYSNAQSKFVEGPNGLRIHYRDQGQSDGSTIVLLHGNYASLHTWEPVISELKNHYRIVTYTQPGHGLTGPNANGDYSYTGMAQALELVTAELGLDRFVLGGNSMGGWVSWRYALENPDRVEALLLLDAAGMPLREGEMAPPLNVGFRLQQFAVGRFFMGGFTPRSLVKKSLLQTVSVKKIVSEEMVDRYWELLRVPGNRDASSDRAQVDRELHYADKVGNINLPTLLIWGEEDALIYASAATSFAERLPVSQTAIYPGVGHLPMEEAPQQTAADIDTFMQSLRPCCGPTAMR